MRRGEEEGEEEEAAIVKGRKEERKKEKKMKDHPSRPFQGLHLRWDDMANHTRSRI